MINGPIAYARIKMDSINCETISSSTLNSAAIVDSAGATIDELTGEMNVKQETVIVAPHFFL